MKYLLLFFMLLIFGPGLNASAQIFSQDFSSSTTYTDYIGVGPNQFTNIATANSGSLSITSASNSLSYTRSASSGSFTIKNVSGVTDFLWMQFKFTLTDNPGAATTAATFQFGQNFNANTNSAEALANVAGRFGINFSANAGEFKIRDITAGTNSIKTYNGESLITFLVNTSATNKSYTNPEGFIANLAPGNFAVWVQDSGGAHDLAESGPVDNQAMGISDVKFIYSNGTGTIHLDNIIIHNFQTLPVKLSSFNGQLQEGKVNLSWATASEENNDRFEIMRSSDGKSWTQIGTVKGHGNSKQLIEYTFIDSDPEPWHNYYQLRQVDFDGGTSLSGIISVKAEAAEMSLIVFSSDEQSLDLSLQSPTAGPARVVILDQANRIVHNETIQLQEGSNSHRIQRDRLPSGLLLVSVDKAGKRVTQKTRN